MSKPKQTPSKIGYWALLGPEMRQFCTAWKGHRIDSRQLHRFVGDWKKVASWGGKTIPSRESQNSLIFAVYCAATYRPRSVLDGAARKRGFVGRVRDAFDENHCGAVQIDLSGASEGIGRAAFHADRFPWAQTPTGFPLVVYDFLATYAQFPDFASAWLAYARQLLNNRTDKELVIRVWLHTHEWTQDPDRPDKLRRWTDASFGIKQIVWHIEHDTDMQVSIRTVSGVIAKMCMEEQELPCDASGGLPMMN